MFVGFVFGGWEVVLLIAVFLVLIGAKHLPPLARGLMQGWERFRKTNDEIGSHIRETARKVGVEIENVFSIRLFVAQGFGIGRIPVAPGTFGSVLGLVWFVMLLATGNFCAYLAGAIEGVAFSIWLCDEAEKILEEKDPGSVVLDEIIAIPFCFLPWVATEWWLHGSLPPVAHFFRERALWLTVAILILFRIFDIWKPWPIRQLQRLPGGWGITVDDLLAAFYVALISLPFVR